MKIIIISSSYKPNIGGVEEAVYNLAKEYKKLGHNVSIITGKWPRSLERKEVIDGIEVERINFIMPTFSVRGILKFMLKFPFIFSMFTRSILSKKPDILHIQCIGPNGFYTLLFKYIYNIPLIVTAQGADVQELPKESRLMKWTLPRLFAKSGFITACSKSLLEKDAKRYITENNKPTTATYNGIALGEFASKDRYLHEKPYIFSIGRFIYKKGFDILIKAFSEVAVKYKDIDLIIAGDGPEKENYVNLIEKSSLLSRIHLVGYADRQKTVKLFNGCEFFVLPSRKEPQGIVNLEAMLASKAIVAASVDGVPEIVKDGFNGLLVEPENPDKLANKIEYLLKNKEIRQNLGENGRKFVKENFTWPKISQQYLELYKRVIYARKD